MTNSAWDPGYQNVLKSRHFPVFLFAGYSRRMPTSGFWRGGMIGKVKMVECGKCEVKMAAQEGKSPELA
jgi:hypothetical protein